MAGNATDVSVLALATAPPSESPKFVVVSSDRAPAAGRCNAVVLQQRSRGAIASEPPHILLNDASATVNLSSAVSVYAGSAARARDAEKS